MIPVDEDDGDGDDDDNDDDDEWKRWLRIWLISKGDS